MTLSGWDCTLGPVSFFLPVLLHDLRASVKATETIIMHADPLQHSLWGTVGGKMPRASAAAFHAPFLPPSRGSRRRRGAGSSGVFGSLSLTTPARSFGAMGAVSSLGVLLALAASVAEYGKSEALVPASLRVRAGGGG